MIATRVTDTHYLQQNHGMILASSENSFPKRTSVFRTEWSFFLQFAGTWQRNRGKAVETMWQLRGHALGSLTWSGKALGVERWRFTVVAGRSDAGTSCPSPLPAGSWKVSYGGCFPHPSAAHITASLELERSQRLMRIPFSWMNPQDEGSSYGCERQWTVFLGIY